MAYSNKIGNASFLAALMVVGIHTASQEPSAIAKGTALWWLEAFGHYGVFAIAVPFFFICSGYFLAAHMEANGWWKRECFKRIKTLLVPYIIWNLVALLLNKYTHDHISYVGHLRCLADALGLNPFAGPSLYPLWYVRSLLIFVIISPILLFVIKRRYGKWMLSMLIVCSFAVSIYGMCAHGAGRWHERIYSMLTYCFSVEGLFYFCCGMYGRMEKVRLPSRGNVVSLIVGFCLAGLGGYCCMSGIKHIIAFWVPFLLFGLWRFIPNTPLPKCLAGQSFVIYVLHVVIFICLGIVYQLVVGQPIPRVGSVPQWVLKLALGVCGSLFIALILRKWCFRLYNLVFGGR